VDSITPLARGCSLLVAGPEADQQSDLLLEMLANQAGSGVRAVYASTGASEGSLAARVERLQARGVMPDATVVAAPPGAPLGEQFAALCAALSIGEAVRDQGAHALVALDSLECAVQLWECVTEEVERSRGNASNGARCVHCDVGLKCTGQVHLIICCVMGWSAMLCHLL
jgi:F0F1-type ATP synthase alpha subunit